MLVLNFDVKKTKKALSGDFVAFDLFTEEKVWHVRNAERVFFSGKEMDSVHKDK